MGFLWLTAAPIVGRRAQNSIARAPLLLLLPPETDGRATVEAVLVAANRKHTVRLAGSDLNTARVGLSHPVGRAVRVVASARPSPFRLAIVRPPGLLMGLVQRCSRCCPPGETNRQRDKQRNGGFFHGWSGQSAVIAPAWE